MRSKSVRLAAVLLVLATLVSCRAQESQPAASPPVANVPRKGHLDVTFLVTADTHFGCKTALATTQKAEDSIPVEQVHAYMIDQMNAIAGQAYPAEVGGKVAKPVGLLVAGDLTDAGLPGQWANFEKLYGLTGNDGRLGMPVYETLGNHDLYFGGAVRQKIAGRHSGDRYSWDWGDLHVACLGAPEDGAIPWLIKDLAAVGKDRPVVIYFHYSVIGPYSEDYWFGKDDNRGKFAKAMEGFNVIAIFHGHFHGSGCYKWQGYDVYDVGAAKNGWKDFAVVHVTDDRLTVAAWNYEYQPGWWWVHSKPINDAAKMSRDEILKAWRHPGVANPPLIPHPREDAAKRK